MAAKVNILAGKGANIFTYSKILSDYWITFWIGHKTHLELEQVLNIDLIEV